MQIMTTTLACTARLVDKRNKACALCRACPEIAHIICALLNVIGRELVLIVDDGIMRRSNGSLQSGVRLQENIEIVNGCDPFVYHCLGLRVGRSVCIFLLSRVETRMVTFTADGKCELRLVVP